MALDERTERFAALYAASRPRLLAYAGRRTACAEDAADVIAETFEIAWVRLDAIPEGEGAVLWLYVTARHVIANHHRRVQRRSEVVQRLTSGLELAFVSEGGPGDIERFEAATALSRLSDDDRELLMLAGWEGLNSRQLACVLGCSPIAARVRLHTARRRLNDVLAELEIGHKHSPRSRHVGDVAPPATARAGQEVEAG